MKKYITYYIIILALLFSPLVKAQVFPVNATPQVVPPYSLKLSEYSTANTDKIFLNLLLTDITESNRQVRLKLYVENNAGLSVQSNDVVIGAAPIFVDGGVPLRLSNIDLQPYFLLQNLVGINPLQYSRPLPEGFYGFCFEVYDALSGRQISRKSCARVYLALANPPFLVAPERNEMVPIKNPQNIFFTWSPGTPGGSRIEYEFTLTELWDVQMDPQAAFLASRPLYQTTTPNNSLLYGPAAPQLLPDKMYGWRIKAIATNGISETSVFKNDGYSEIFHFTYTDACKEPEFVLSEAKGPTSEKILWQGVDHERFKIQYRKKDAENAAWFESSTVNEYTTIYNLEPGTTYEFRVGGECLENGGYTYSQIYEFTTIIPGDETSTYNCGITPEIVITNQDPIETLVINDVFTAGDFPVTVKSVTSGNVDASSPNGGGAAGGGGYSGWGYIVVPYLEDTKLKVSFNGIGINTDYQLISGIVYTDYDENWGGVDDVSDELQSLEDLISSVAQTIDRLLEKGEITEEEAEAYKEQVEQATVAQTALEEAKEELEETEATEDEAAIAEAQENLSDSEETAKEERQDLSDLADRLNSIENANDVTQNGSVVSDAYFDGVIPFSTPDKNISNPQTDGATLFTNLDEEPEDKNPDGTFFTSETLKATGSSKRYIITRSNIGDELENNEEYQSIKNQMSNLGDDQFLLWIHYDFKENKAKYKVAFEGLYYYDQIAQNELVQLYNSVLNFDIRGSIGTAIVATAEYFDTLLLEFKDYAPFMNEEFLSSGYTTYELLQMVVEFVKNCGKGYATQNSGLVPRCLWDQNINPTVAYQAGFIDGAFEIAEVVWQASEFFSAWTPTNPFFYSSNAEKIRQQTIDIVLMIKKLDDQDILMSTVWDEVSKSFGEYVDETVALTPQARYNQGKLIFEVVSFFFGVGEAKAFLKTGKLTSKTLTALKNLPKSYAKLVRGLQSSVKVVIKRIDDTASAIIVEGQQIARMTKDKLIILEKAFLESLDENLQPVGQLVTPDGMVLQLDDGRSISDRILSIVKDTGGKYKAAVGKLDNIPSYVKKFLNDDIVKDFRQQVIDEDLLNEFPMLSIDELTAIKTYTSDVSRNGKEIYLTLNEQLRSNNLDDFSKGLNELLSSALSKLNKFDGKLVFRGVYGEEARIAKSWKKGDEIIFKDYKSSSINENIAQQFSGDVLYEISNPKGYNICNISCLRGEVEIIFKAGSKFEVIDLSYLPRLTESDPIIKVIKLSLKEN